MDKINWVKIAGIVAVTGLVFVSLFSFTAFLRRIADFSWASFINMAFTMVASVAAIYYISKTNYGSSEKTDVES